MDEIDNVGSMRVLLAHIGYPESKREIFVAAMEPLLAGGSSKAIKTVREFLKGRPIKWPEYDRRLEELQGAGLSIEQAFYSAVTGDAYMRYRILQMIAITTRNPYWLFRFPVDEYGSHEPCRSLDGRIERYDSEFWRGRSARCWRPDCRSAVFSLRESEAPK